MLHLVACVRACVRACMCACVCACMCACVCACVSGGRGRVRISASFPVPDNKQKALEDRWCSYMYLLTNKL